MWNGVPRPHVGTQARARLPAATSARPAVLRARTQDRQLRGPDRPGGAVVRGALQAVEPTSQRPPEPPTCGWSWGEAET